MVSRYGPASLALPWPPSLMPLRGMKAFFFFFFYELRAISRHPTVPLGLSPHHQTAHLLNTRWTLLFQAARRLWRRIKSRSLLVHWPWPWVLIILMEDKPHSCEWAKGETSSHAFTYSLMSLMDAKHLCRTNIKPRGFISWWKQQYVFSQDVRW